MCCSKEAERKQKKLFGRDYLTEQDIGVSCERQWSYRFSRLYGSEEEIKLREGGGETAGEEREAPDSATGAQGEESSGTSALFTRLLLNIYNIFILIATSGLSLR